MAAVFGPVDWRGGQAQPGINPSVLLLLTGTDLSQVVTSARSMLYASCATSPVKGLGMMVEFKALPKNSVHS